MSVSDPLIKELKGYTIRLVQESEKHSRITDDCSDLLPFCQSLEMIFQKGCTSHSWNWLDGLAREMELGAVEKSFNYFTSVEMVKACQKVRTPTGKIRLLIRYCLVYNCLHVPIQIMVRSLKDRLWHWYHISNSILGDEILGEIFLSVILQCSTLSFKLNINNARFLDNTLLLPLCVKLEFVPCNSLGIAVSFADDKAVIVNVDENSIAAEDDQIEVGDILDELNGNVLRTEMRGKLSKIMAKSKNKPVNVVVIKTCSKNGYTYPPAVHLLKKTNIDINQIQGQTEGVKHVKDVENTSCNLRSGFVVNFIGSIEIGSEGDVRQVERAIVNVLEAQKDTIPAQVHIDCQELGLKVIEENSGQILFNNHFMEISACGQTKKHPHHFAYIVGDNICNLASKFTCHVFHSLNDNDINTILQSMGHGFQRTLFAV